jgi:hypothetical protein
LSPNLAKSIEISGIFIEKMKYWLFIVAGLMSCNAKPASQPGKTLSSGDLSGKAVSGRDQEIENLVFTLRCSDCAYFGGIGIEGKESPVFDAYKRLLKIAPDSLWVRLSYSDKPVVRLYALEALVKKNSPLLDGVERRLKNDSAGVCTIADDLGISYSISDAVALHDTSESRRNNYFLFNTIKSEIPPGVDISPENMCKAIYVLGSDSLERRTIFITKNFAFVTTFENLGQGLRTNLYVIDLVHRSLIRDPDFQRDYLYSSAGIFVIETGSGRIFSVDAPALYESKNEVIVPASLYEMKGRHFHFIRNVYEAGEEAPGGAALMAFFKAAVATHNRRVLALPEDWWRVK